MDVWRSSGHVQLGGESELSGGALRPELGCETSAGFILQKVASPHQSTQL